MSQFLNAAQPNSLVRASDCSLWLDRYMGEQDAFPPFESSCQFVQVDCTGIEGNITPWWPQRSHLCCEGGGLSDIQESNSDFNYQPSGASERMSFVGVTRDQYGSPLPGATVRCFLTSTGAITATVVSDANGAFIITSPYYAPHFLTIHGADGFVAGATVSSLVPA